MHILSLVDHLYKNAFPVPQIFLTRHNELFLKHKNHFLALFSYVEGDFIPFTKLNKEQLSSIAVNLSLMHKLLLDYSPKGSKRSEDMFNFEIEYAIQKNIFPKIVHHQPFKEVRSIIEELKVALPQMEIVLKEFSEKMTKGFVHNDFQEENIKFGGNAISGIFDFDDSCPGAVVSDLAIAINNFCFDNDKFNEEKRDLFIKQYEKNMKLSQLEKKALIPLMIHTNSFSIHNSLRLWSTDLANEQYHLSVIRKSYQKLKILSAV